MASSTTLMARIKTELKSEHMEVSIRMGVAMLLSYILTFAHLPNLIPIDTNIVLGLLVPFCVMLFPTLTFTVGSVILPFLSVFFFLYLSSTALLAISVWGGNSAFIIAFAIWSFWVTFTRFDKAEGNKTSIVLIGVVFQCALIWPTFVTVQDGITLPNRSLTPNIEDALMAILAEAMELAMELGTGTHSIKIPTGILEGRMSEITISDDGIMSQTKIEGGMWIVKAAWTASGMQNPFASYRNMTICLCWIMLFLSVAVMLPPFRTMRSTVWRGILPGALKEAAQSLRLNSKRMKQVEKDDDPNDCASAEKEDGLDETGEEMRLATRGRCAYFLSTLYGGSLARYTAFEPRMLALTAPDPTVETLVQLCYEVSRCLRIAVGIELFMDPNDKSGFLQENLDEYDNIANILDKCAQAMFTGDATVLDTEELKKSLLEPNEEYYDPFKFKKAVLNVVGLVRKWLKQMNGEKTEGLVFFSKLWHMNLFKVIAPWIYMQLSLFLFLFRALLKIFSKASWEDLIQRKFYSLPKFIWCVKYAFGMTVLLLMLLAWPGYREGFVLASKNDPSRDLYGPQNGSWVIIAYCFATTQTAEGSAKKGILRMLGT